MSNVFFRHELKLRKQRGLTAFQSAVLLTTIFLKTICYKDILYRSFLKILISVSRTYFLKNKLPDHSTESSIECYKHIHVEGSQGFPNKLFQIIQYDCKYSGQGGKYTCRSLNITYVLRIFPGTQFLSITGSCRNICKHRSFCAKGCPAILKHYG